MIRPATADDHAAYVVLERELGLEEPPLSAQRYRERAADTLVYERDGEVIGYVTTYRLARSGYVRNLVVARAHRRAGLGRELMRAAGEQLRSSGASEWHLSVAQGNAPALGLYRQLGMVIDHRSTVVRLAWQLADALPRAEAIASSVSPEEDDELERAFGLLSGRLAMRRSGRVLVQLRDDSCAAVGLACFDADAQGASPFCTARPGLAGALLAALRPHVPRGQDWIHLVAEDAPELALELLGAGGELRLSLLHLTGPL
jgi:GNAT superfamily N-acetyltransferase